MIRNTDDLVFYVSAVGLFILIVMFFISVPESPPEKDAAVIVQDKPIILIEPPQPKPVPSKPLVYKYSCSDSDECVQLAEAIYFEAGIEPFIGKVAVGYVVTKRVSLKYYPDTIEGVIYNLCHFTYTCNSDLDRGIIYNSKQWKDSLYAAELVLRRIVPDPTNGADHYFNPREVNKAPRWSEVYPWVSSIGLHEFYKRNH